MSNQLRLHRRELPSKVFFDISGMTRHLKRSPYYSGIQRVVASIVAEFVDRSCEPHVYLSYIDAHGTIQCIQLTKLNAETLRSSTRMRSALYGEGDLLIIQTALRKYLGSRHKYFYHRTRLDAAACLGLEKPFRRKNISPAKWLDARRKKSSRRADFLHRMRPLLDCAKPGDQLVILDSSWNKDFVAPFCEAHDAGLEIFTLIHDLIPLKAPETLDSSMSTEFCRYLVGALSYTDHFLANSDYTRKDLLEFFENLEVKRDVQTLRLAQTGLEHSLPDISLEALEGIENIFSCYTEAVGLLGVSPEVRAATTVPFVLCVGTIEARKNVWRLAMAWRRMFDRGVPDLPRLVFAGRPGTLSGSFFELLNATGSLGGIISVIEGPTDRELDYMYRRCQFFAMPSLFEGWGLPVGEGLAYGKTGLVSCATSLPEVGGDLVQYCDPNSLESIATAAEALIRTPENRVNLERRLQAAKLRSWTDVASDLATTLELCGKE